MRLTKDAAKFLEAAARELGMTATECERFISGAEEFAAMDYRDTISGADMLGALGRRWQSDAGRWYCGRPLEMDIA